MKTKKLKKHHHRSENDKQKNNVDCTKDCVNCQQFEYVRGLATLEAQLQHEDSWINMRWSAYYLLWILVIFGLYAVLHHDELCQQMADSEL